MKVRRFEGARVRGDEGTPVRRFERSTVRGFGFCPTVRGFRRPVRGTSGFTLIELLIVMSLIVLLASVVLALYGNSVTRAREAALSEDLFQMRKAIDEYYADKGKYPADLGALVSDKYLRSIPTDPFTGTADTWQPVQSDIDPGNPAAEAGISDVKSGSEQTGLDGKPYAEWE